SRRRARGSAGIGAWCLRPLLASRRGRARATAHRLFVRSNGQSPDRNVAAARRRPAGRPGDPHRPEDCLARYGASGVMKIAVIFDALHPEWEDADFKREIEQKAEEAEYDVARALIAGEHDVLIIGRGAGVGPARAELESLPPDVGLHVCG